MLPADPPPRFDTARNLGRQTLGGKVAKVSLALGAPFMPHQRHIADVACEIDPATGGYWYREVRVIWTRQTGKTTVLRAKGVHRCLAAPSQRHVYTAQTRNMARQRLEEAFYEPIADSAVSYFLARTSRDKPGFVRRPGSEHIHFANKSRWWIDAVTKKSGHGPPTDEGHIDEAFAHADARIEQALRPAMATRPNAQLWVVSAAGDQDSIYLRAKVDDGRARVAQGRLGRVAYFEYSAPDDADADDPATWISCIPSLGHRFPDGTGITLETIQAERDSMDDDEFRRAYLGQWRDRDVLEAVIPADAWLERLDEQSEITGRVFFALDTSPMMSWSAFAAAGLRADGLVHGEITGRGDHVDWCPGTAWVVPRAVELRDRFPGFKLHIAAGSMALSLKPALERAGIDVVVIPPQDVVAACGLLYSLAMPGLGVGEIRHLGQPELANAIANAQKKDVADGGFIWVRRRSTGDICALYALTVAVWAAAAEIEASVWTAAALELCDACGQRPHDDPDGTYGYRCPECRDEGGGEDL